MEALVFAPFAWLYQILMRLDRMLTTKRRLPCPVISVGNIALGGRAKTPMVIYLCRKLKSAGFAPVVLTRGYGRANKAAVVWTGGVADSANMGDEAVEIARSGAADAVLVGARRAQNAQGFLFAQESAKPWVFVLDDGFQHWALSREVDVVLVTEGDLSNRVLPWGELRESPASLDRADFVLKLGQDVVKETQLAPTLAELQPSAPLLVLTTRASAGEYLREMKRRFPLAEICALRDHATTQAMVNSMCAFAGKDVLLGDKEAVKLLSDVEYRAWISQGTVLKRYGHLEKKLHRVALHITWSNEHQALQKIFAKLRQHSAGALP